MWSDWLVFCDFGFQSALWWRRTRGLWKLSNARDSLRGKLDLVLMGGAMLSKSLIQFSADGWSCVPSLLLEKEMAAHSSTIVWKIPWTEEPNRLKSMGSQRVRQDWATKVFKLYTMVEVMKIMVASFKRFHARTATLSAANPATGHHQPMPPMETPGHSQANLGQSLVGSLLLSPGSWCTQGFVWALKYG